MKQTRPDNAHRQPEPHIDFEDRLEYRILCNSEHFLVLNPNRPKPKGKREGEKEPRRRGKLLIRKWVVGIIRMSVVFRERLILKTHSWFLIVGSGFLFGLGGGKEKEERSRIRKIGKVTLTSLSSPHITFLPWLCGAFSFPFYSFWYCGLGSFGWLIRRLVADENK